MKLYECENFEDSPHKEKCTRSQENKVPYISQKFIDQRQESYENIMSIKVILYRMNRSIQVE